MPWITKNSATDAVDRSGEPELTEAIRKVHDFLTVGAPAPLQEACAVGLDQLGPEYYAEMVRDYKERGEILVSALQDAGFRCSFPEGAYYVLADVSHWGEASARDAAMSLLVRTGVAAVPESAFYSGSDGDGLLRFCYALEEDVVAEAARRIRAL